MLEGEVEEVEGDPGPGMLSTSYSVPAPLAKSGDGHRILKVPGKHEGGLEPWIPPSSVPLGWLCARGTTPGSLARFNVFSRSLSFCHYEGVEEQVSPPCVLWLGSHQSVPSTGTFTGGASRGLALPVTVMFAYCSPLPSATPHKDDSLVLFCSEPPQD